MTDTKTFAIDVAERAGKTFIQGAGAAAALILVTVDSSNVASASWWQQVLAAAATGGVAAVASLITSVTGGLKTGTASLSKTVAATAVAQSTAVSSATISNGTLQITNPANGVVIASVPSFSDEEIAAATAALPAPPAV